MLSALRDLLCSKQCLHNRPGPSHGTTKGGQVSDQVTPYRGVLPGLYIAH